MDTEICFYLNNENGEKIQEIRNAIEADDKLYAPTDDLSILRFLICCKFDVKKTQKRFYNYYSQRTSMPEWFSNRDPLLPQLEELLKLGVFIPIRNLDADGKMIIVIRASIHKPHQHKQHDVIKTGMMILDIAMRNNASISLHGVVVIFDMTGVTLNHGLEMTPRIIQGLANSWQGCYPLRIHSLNFVNVPMHVNIILNIFKRFMNQKMRGKIYIHSGSIIELFQIRFSMSHHLMPIEYGGKTGTLQELIDYWKHETEINRDWLMEDEKYRAIVL